jgi:hypothetical protein
MRYPDGNALKEQAYGERIGAPPLNPMECGFFQTPPDLVVKFQPIDIVGFIL